MNLDYITCRIGDGPVTIDGPFADNTRPHWFVKVFAPWVSPYRVISYDVFLDALVMGDVAFTAWLRDRLNVNLHGGQEPSYIKCACCGTVLRRAKKKIAHSRSGLNFCSHSCQAKTTNKNRKGLLSPYSRWLSEHMIFNDPARCLIESPPERLCAECGFPIPSSKRVDAKTCSDLCRRRRSERTRR